MNTFTPGIHDITPAEYHEDPVYKALGVPSLSSSGIRTLLSDTPAHFAARHPGLTDWPDYAEESTKAQDLGNVVHAIVLGKGAEYIVGSPSDFLTKKGEPYSTWSGEAKEWKEARKAEGLIVLDRDTFAVAELIANRARAALKARFGNWPFGESEVPMFWQWRNQYGEMSWGRALLDHWSHRMCTIVDLKTTGAGISDFDLQKKAENELATQAAWYTLGAQTLHPEIAGLLQFVFVFIETEPPYLTRIVRLSNAWMNLAAQRNDIAAAKFAMCVKNNSWPAYPDTDVPLDMPSNVEARWSLQIEMAG